MTNSGAFMFSLAAQMARRIFQLTRAGDWWLYHVSPLLAVAYAAVTLYELRPAQALPGLLRLLLSMICIAAYSHVVNDMGDVEQDRRAGKANAMQAWRPWQRLSLCLCLLFCGFAVWIGAGVPAWVVALLAMIAVLQPLYAWRPIRLKERGAWGLLIDSLHTHALPTLFCAVFFAGLTRRPIEAPFTIMVTLWSLFVGMRGIMYHQLIDEANDRKAGTRTFVTAVGPQHAMTITRWLIFPAEIIALCLLGATVHAFAPTLVSALVLYAGVMLLAWLLGIWQVPSADPIPVTKGEYVPLLTFYRIWPAIGFAVLLTARDWRFAVVLVLHTAFVSGVILRQGYDLGYAAYWRCKKATFRRLVRRLLFRGLSLLQRLTAKASMR